MLTRRIGFALFVVALAGALLTHPAAAQTGKKVVFLAAPKDHGVPGRHEYVKDMTVLAYCLEHASNLKGFTTKVMVGRATTIDDLKDASLIVLDGDGDRSRQETNPIFPLNPPNNGPYPPETVKFLDDFGQLMKKGVGLAIFHYTTEIGNETARKDLLEWVGGYYAGQPGVRNNPVDDWTMTLKNETHPILQGVKPWNYKEEIFTHFTFADGAVPLVVAKPATAGFEPRDVAWAFQRKDGGRGFGFGGLDMHANLLLEDHRRLVLNGLVWAARMEVPPGGVQCTVPDEVMK